MNPTPDNPRSADDCEHECSQCSQERRRTEALEHAARILDACGVPAQVPVDLIRIAQFIKFGDA